MIKRRPRSPSLEPWDKETKLDQWVTPDVETALETALAELTHQLDRMRHCDRDQQKEHLLALMEGRLQVAREAVYSLRRRVANDKRLR